MKKPKFSSQTLEISKEIANSCIRCKKCMKECVMMNDFGECPQDIFKGFLEDEDINPMIPYSCNLCKKCTIVCPVNLKMSEAFMGIRETIIEAKDGKSILKGLSAVNMHQLLGFMNIFTTRRK